MLRRDQRRRNYRRGRKRLIAELGGQCVRCGSKRKLEFHHKTPRDWEPAKTSRWVRLARYRREAAQGVVELLCRHCNAVAGPPDDPNAKPLTEWHCPGCGGTVGQCICRSTPTCSMCQKAYYSPDLSEPICECPL